MGNYRSNRLFAVSAVTFRRLLLVFVGMLSFAQSAWAAGSANDIPWSGQRFRYTATQKSLHDLLVEFGTANGINIVVAPELDKQVSVRLNDPPQVVLNSLSASYGLIWFYDGSVLYVEPATSARTEVVRMSFGKVTELMALLRNIKIPEGRYRLNPDVDQNLLIVSGPSRFVDLVKTLANSLDATQAARRQTAVKVFPLKRAWAADFRVRQNGKDMEMPGVVSLLRKLYAPPGTRSPSASSAGGSSPPVAEPRIQSSSMQGDRPADKKGAPSMTPRLSMGQSAPDNPPPPPRESGLPSFEADPSSNSVLVRDYWDRIDQYAGVIESLDKGGGLIEIEVSIMDISSQAFGQLGMDWELFSARVDSPGLFGRASLVPSADSLSLPGGLPRLPGLVANAVIGGSQRRLIARVSALEQTGQGRIVARPKVLTMNNVEAILENTETFYVKTEGQYSSNLFDVTAGTSVRVMPLILTRGDSAGVKMAISIEDGGILEQTDSNIPRIKRSSINTQAVVGEGESVLLAGYSRDSESKTRAGVPWLSTLPVFGNLFGSSARSSSREERYYLVTPRIIRPTMAFEQDGQNGN